MEKTVLCYGDSNTWGYIPGEVTMRYPRDTRWPGRLQELLGEGYYVIEEGLNSRTTVWEDPTRGDRSGLTYIVPCLQSHKPLDLVIVMLGSNDTKRHFGCSTLMIATGMKRVLDAILFSRAGRDKKAPQILLIAPPLIREEMLEDPDGFVQEMGEEAPEKSRSFSRFYRALAEEYGIHFLDAAEICEASLLDGLHLDAEGHKALSYAVCVKVREILE